MSPVFAHGQLRLYLLVLLDEGPRHGYEVIQELESRFNGLYSPSAGTVYPRLAKLEEEGLVQRTDDGRKATYAITDAGRAEVRARQADVQDMRDDLDQSVRQLAEQVRSRVEHQAADLRDRTEERGPRGPGDGHSGRRPRAVDPGRGGGLRRPRAGGQHVPQRRPPSVAPRRPDRGPDP